MLNVSNLFLKTRVIDCTFNFCFLLFSWKPFNFSKEQVRVLLFRECDWRGRKLLFDSNAVQKVSLENQPCSKLKFGSRQKSENKKTDAFVEVTNGYGYQV